MARGRRVERPSRRVQARSRGRRRRLGHPPTTRRPSSTRDRRSSCAGDRVVCRSAYPYQRWPARRVADVASRAVRAVRAWCARRRRRRGRSTGARTRAVPVDGRRAEASSTCSSSRWFARLPRVPARGRKPGVMSAGSPASSHIGGRSGRRAARGVRRAAQRCLAAGGLRATARARHARLRVVRARGPARAASCSTRRPSLARAQRPAPSPRARGLAAPQPRPRWARRASTSPTRQTPAGRASGHVHGPCDAV